MFFHGVFPAQVFPDQVFPDGESDVPFAAEVYLVGSVAMRVRPGGLLVRAGPRHTEFIGALNPRTQFNGVLDFTGPELTTLVGAVDIRTLFNGTLSVIAPIPEPADLFGSVGMSFTLGGTLEATNQGWRLRTSQGEGWTVVN